MKYKCTENNCNGYGVWGGCLPCPALMGGKLDECQNRRPVPRSEDQCEIKDLQLRFHAALRPNGLRAIACGVEENMSEAAIQLIQDDPKTPEWVKKFLIGEILPAMAVSVESLRVAAVALQEYDSSI